MFIILVVFIARFSLIQASSVASSNANYINTTGAGLCSWYTVEPSTLSTVPASTTPIPTADNGSFIAAQSCNAASLSWFSKYGSWSSWRSSSVGAVWTPTYMTPANATPYTTLCDGRPRAHGSALFTQQRVLQTASDYAFSGFFTPSSNSDKPQCTIAPAECSYLYDRASKAAGYPTVIVHNSRPFVQPACPSPTYTTASNCAPRSDVAVYGIAGTQVPCVVTGGPVKLAYWPVTVRGDLCGNRTTTQSNGSSIPTASIFGTTVASPDVIVSFETLYAVDGCGHTVGSALSNFLMTQQSTQVKSQCGAYHAGLGTGTVVNYVDFASPVPWSAYSCLPQCGGNGGGAAVDYCSTIYDDYYPNIALPTDVFKLQAAWSTCVTAFMGDILWDPPISLTPASIVAAVTMHPQASTTTAAEPASTPPSTFAASTSMISTQSESWSSSQSSSSNDQSPMTASKSYASPPHGALPSPSASQATSAARDSAASASLPTGATGDSQLTAQPSASNTVSSTQAKSSSTGIYPASVTATSKSGEPGNETGYSERISPSFSYRPAQSSERSSPDGAASTTSAALGGIIASIIGNTKGSPTTRATPSGSASAVGSSIPSTSALGQPVEMASLIPIATFGSLTMAADPQDSGIAMVGGTTTVRVSRSLGVSGRPPSPGTGEVAGSSVVSSLTAASSTTDVLLSAFTSASQPPEILSQSAGWLFLGSSLALKPGQTTVVSSTTVVATGYLTRDSTTLLAASPVTAVSGSISLSIGAVITLGTETLTALAPGATSASGSNILAAGQVTTVGTQIVSDASNAVVVGVQTVTFSPLSISLPPVVTDTGAGSMPTAAQSSVFGHSSGSASRLSTSTRSAGARAVASVWRGGFITSFAVAVAVMLML